MGKQSSPQALIESSRGSTAQSLWQEIGKSTAQLTLNTVAVAGWLSAHRRQEEAQEKARPHQPTLAEVVAASAGRVPNTFKSRLQRALHDKPSARQEAEGSERLRWLRALVLLVERSLYTNGQSLCAPARQSDHAGCRQESGHLGDSSPSPPRLLSVPNSLEHFVGFLRARASEPCNRGALYFHHEVTRTEQVNRHTRRRLCTKKSTS